MADAKGLNSLERSEHISPEDTGDNVSAKRVANYEYTLGGWKRMGLSNTARFDVEGTIIYVGEALVGTDETTTGWEITKYDTTDMTNGSGKVATNVAWVDRVTGNYL